LRQLKNERSSFSSSFAPSLPRGRGVHRCHRSSQPPAAWPASERCSPAAWGTWQELGAGRRWEPCRQPRSRAFPFLFTMPCIGKPSPEPPSPSANLSRLLGPQRRRGAASCLRFSLGRDVSPCPWRAARGTTQAIPVCRRIKRART